MLPVLRCILFTVVYHNEKSIKQTNLDGSFSSSECILFSLTFPHFSFFSGSPARESGNDELLTVGVAHVHGLDK
jgi:hypothetical protein